MLSRAEFDKFLQLYGIPTSDARYEQYKKTQSMSLANQQFVELANQVKQKVDKPTMPSSTVIGPGAMEDRKAAMDKYNKQLLAYDRQQLIIKSIQQGMADKVKYYDQREKTKKTTTVPYESPQDLKDLKGKLNTLPKTIEVSTPEQQKAYHDRLDAEYQKYKKNHHPIYDTPTQRIPKPNPIPNTNKHINHNIMSFQQYKDFQFNQGFGVGQSQYKHYLQGFGITKPTPYLKSQMTVENNKQGHASLAKGQSIEEHNKTHSKNILQHLTQGNVAVPGQIEKKTPPPAIVLHNFSTPTPAAHEHTVSAHTLNKQARTMAGNPKNPPPKLVSGPREDNHLNPTPQPNPVGAAITSGVQSAIVPQAPAGQIQGETFAEFRARTRPNTTPAPPPQDQDAGDMIL